MSSIPNFATVGLGDATPPADSVPSGAIPVPPSQK